MSHVSGQNKMSSVSKSSDLSKPAENSVFLRALWLALAFVCLFLIWQVDSGNSSITIGLLKIPLLIIYFWLAIAGCYFSYIYREQNNPWVVRSGLSVIAIVCYWFINNMQYQFQYAPEIDLLIPTLHLVAGLFVCHSFELRSRFDFNFSLGLSVLLVFVTSTLGKGGIFGFAILLYVLIASTLLLLDCEARTFGTVQAREFDEIDPATTLSIHQSSEKTANLIFPCLSLIVLSILFFMVVPRAESVADHLTAQAYSFVRKLKHPKDAGLHFGEGGRRVRLPLSRFKRLKMSEDGKIPAREGDIVNDAKLTTDIKAKFSAESDTKDLANSKLGTNKKVVLDKNAKEEVVSKSKHGIKDEVKAEIKDSRHKNADESVKSKSKIEQINKNTSLKNNEKKEELAENFSKNELDKLSKTAKAEFSEELKPKVNKTSQIENKNQSHNSSNNSSQQNFSSLKADPKKVKSSRGSNSQISTKVNSKTVAPVTGSVISENLNQEGTASYGEDILFTVSCNRTVCFRQTTYDAYDGKIWSISDKNSIREFQKNSNGEIYIADYFPLTVPPSVAVIHLEQKFRISQNMGYRLFQSGSPVHFSYPGIYIRGDICGNLKGNWSLVKDLEYGVSSEIPVYDLNFLRNESVPPADEEEKIRTNLEKFLQVPDNQPERVDKLALEIAGSQDNWFVQSDKICQYLRKNYKYNYGSKYTTSNPNCVDNFLFGTKEGDCKDFAAAFVMLCRSIDIPARLVSGYNSSEFDPSTGNYTIRVKNAHAWGEVYIPSAGWMPFDACPNGQMPQRSTEKERYFNSLQNTVNKTLSQVVLSQNENNAKNTNNISNKNILLNKKKIGANSTNTVNHNSPKKSGETIKIIFTLLDLLHLGEILFCLLLFIYPLIFFMRVAVKKIIQRKNLHPASKSYLKLQKELSSLGTIIGSAQSPYEFKDSWCLNIKDKMDSEKFENLQELFQAFIDNYQAAYFGSDDSKVRELENKRRQFITLLRSILSKTKNTRH